MLEMVAPEIAAMSLTVKSSAGRPAKLSAKEASDWILEPRPAVSACSVILICLTV